MAEQFGIKLAVSYTDLLRSLNETIQKLNESKNVTKLKLGVNTNALTQSIKVSIGEINASEKLKSKPVALTVSTAKLRDSLSRAISEINRNGSLSNKTVNINAKLNLSDLKKQIQQQITNTSQLSGTVQTGDLANETALTSIKKVRSELAAEGEQLKQNNNFVRERITLFTKSNTLKTSKKFGSQGENTTVSLTNGNLTSVTRVTDKSKIASEQAKATAAINETRIAAEKLRDSYADINAIKPLNENTIHFKELENRYNEIIGLTNKFEAADVKNTEQFKVNMSAKTAEFKRLIALYQKAEYSPSSLRAKDINTLKSISANQFREFVAQIKNSDVPFKQMEATINGLQASLEKISDAGSFNKFSNKFNIAKSEFSALKSESKAFADELSKTESVTIRITSALKKLSHESSLGIFAKNSGSQSVIDMQARFDSITKKFVAMQKGLANNSSAENIERIKNGLVSLERQLESVLADSNSLKNTLANLKLNNDLERKAFVLIGQIAEYERKNDDAMNVRNPLSGQTFGAELAQIKAAIPNAQDLGMLEQLNGRFVTIRSNIKALGKEGNIFLTEMRGKLSKFIKWMAMTTLVMRARTYVNKLFTTVYELNTELVDLKKTFNGSAEELNDFYFEANRLAKLMGATTAEIIKQGAAFSRLGYSSNETMKKMAEMSAMFAAISPDMNVEEAQNGLVSIMKAFDIDPENVLDGVLSKVNIIGNTAATSNGEIVEMLKRSSAAMREANNTLEQTVALESAAIEVTRDAPGTGVAFKTISSRLRGLDEETLEVIEDVEVLTGKFADATKTANNPNGISLFTDASKNTYKSTFQIFKELTEIWDDLTDRQTAELADIMGGKRQLQVVAAAIENFDAAEKALDNMANSAGSAEPEMETIRESAAFALNELKETFTALAQDSVSQDFLKDLIKTGTGAINVLDTLVKAFGAFPVVVGAAAGAITAFKRKGKGLFGYNGNGNLTFWGADTSGGFKSWFNEKTDPTGQKAQIKNDIAAVKAFDNAIKNNQMNLQTYNAVMKSSNDEVKRYGRAVMQGADSTQAFKKVNGQLKAEMSLVGKNAKIAATGVKQLNLAMKALNTIGSMVVSMGISWAISKVFEAISDAVNSMENNISRIKDLNSEISGIESEIKDLNEQLIDTKTRIAELQGMPKLTLLEQDELNRLIQSNDELERQIRLKKGQLAEDLNENHQKALDVLKEMATPPDLQSDKWWNYIPFPAIQSVINLIVGANKKIKNLSLDDQLEDLEEYKNTLEEINTIKASDDYLANPSKFEKEITEKEKKLGELNDNIYSYYNNYWSVLQNGLDPNISKEKKYLDIINEAINDWDVLQKKVASTFEELYNDSKYTNVKNYLKDLAAQGELTVEKFESLTDSEIKGIEEFKEELKSIPNASIKNAVEAIIKDAEKAKNEVNNFTATLEKLYEVLDDIIGKQEKLADAFKKIQRGAALTAQEMYELIKEMPDLAQYIERTTDGYAISDKGISAVSEKNQKQARENAEKDLEVIRKQIALLEQQDELKKKRDELEKEMTSSNGSIGAFRRWDNADVEYRKAVEACQGITDTLEELKTAEQSILVVQDVLDKVFDGFVAADNYEDAKSKISDYNKDIQALDKAIESLNEGTSLSYDEMIEIVEIAPELQDFFTEMQDGYTISADKIEEWRKKSFEARNEYIQGLIEQAKTELKAAEDAKLAAEVILNIQNKFGNAAEQLAAQIELEAAEKRIKDILDVIEMYEALMGDIKSPDNRDNLSNELQNQIDYYKTILDAVQIVRDKYNASLEKEKEYLEDVKDSLKEANDERQREIDLKEAAKNLENAKKRKVYVYSEGEGFKQVSDEGAIKDAEEKYRDAITEIQIAEIDKEIELRERQKEALEENTKALTELEQNIENCQTVEQAKAALGITDEKDFLNLPDSVKDDITNGLADAIVKKSNEENKDKVDANGKSLYKPVTLDDVLKSMGATVTVKDLHAMKNSLPTEAVYNAVSKGIADGLNEYKEQAVNSSVVNNNCSGNTFNITVNEAKDGTNVAEVVRNEITDLLTKYCNSIK